MFKTDFWICENHLPVCPFSYWCLWLGTLYCEQKDCFRRKGMGGCMGKTEGISYLSSCECHEMQSTDLKVTLVQCVTIVWKEAVIMPWLDLWSFNTPCGWIIATFSVSSLSLPSFDIFLLFFCPCYDSSNDAEPTSFPDMCIFFHLGHFCKVEQTCHIVLSYVGLLITVLLTNIFFHLYFCRWVVLLSWV